METVERVLSSREVCRLLGIAYRQMDYQVRAGRIPGQPPERGSGVPREWTPAQVERLREIVEARRKAREMLSSIGAGGSASDPITASSTAVATGARLDVPGLLSRAG